MTRKIKNWFYQYKKRIINYSLLLCLIVSCLMIATNEKPKELEYPQFIQMLNNKEFKEADYELSEKTFIIYGEKGEKYKVENPQTENFKETLLKNNVKMNHKFNLGNFLYRNLSIIMNLITMLFVIGMFQKANPSTSMKDTLRENPQTTLKDVTVAESVKQDLSILIKYMKNPQKYEKQGIKMPNGILLVGPPGTGKTLLARAIAGEAKCSFYALSGSDFVEMYVGRGASRVRDLFKEARTHAPAVVFIDELDAIGAQRNQDNNSERDQTINALLTELDGFDNRGNVMIIAATNRVEILDKALTRSGRFGKQIMIPLPMTQQERLEILKLHSDELLKNVDLNYIAKLTTGFSGADLANILNESKLLSLKHNREYVTTDDVVDAISCFLTKGHRKEKYNNIEEKKRVAYHEAGHAIVSKLLCDESVSQISIIPMTSGVGGFTMSNTDENITLYTEEMLIHKIMTLYAGRAAEELIFHNASTGAANDIEKATELLITMCTKCGFNKSDTTENILLNYPMIQPNLTDNMSKICEEKSTKIYQQTLDFLQENIDLLHNITNVLIQKETLSEDEFNQIIGQSLQ